MYVVILYFGSLKCCGYVWFDLPVYGMHGMPTCRRILISYTNPSWIWPWMKSMSNELRLFLCVRASQLLRRNSYNIISNRLWRHQWSIKQVGKTRGWCVKIGTLFVFYVLFISYEKHDNIFTVVTNFLYEHSGVMLVCNSLAALHQHNTPMSAYTVRHSSTYIILYVFTCVSANHTHHTFIGSYINETTGGIIFVYSR